MPEAPPNRCIDIHHHFLPPTWRSAMESAGVLPPKRRNWSAERSLEVMDRADVTTAILSTGQALWRLGSEKRDAVLIKSARESNEYGASIAEEHRGRFGLWASLPLSDIDSALDEIAYAIDTLKVFGFGLPSSCEGKYLGDPVFMPIVEELNRRKAIVFIHPTESSRCASLLPEVVPNVIEYAADTTRSIISLVVNDVPHRYPDIRFIFSHAGGVMPFLIERIVVYLGSQNERRDGRGNLRRILDNPEPESPVRALRRFYYDTAQVANHVNMTSLKQVVGASQILFGSDYPYTTLVDHIDGLERCSVFDDNELRSIYAANWETLITQQPSALATQQSRRGISPD
jgi:6-methylsalicylate decarboxylase